MNSELELQKKRIIFLFNQIKDNIFLNKRGVFSYSEDDMSIYYEFKNQKKEKGVIIYIPNKYDNEMSDCTDEHYEIYINEENEYKIWIKIGIVIDYGGYEYDRIKDVYSIIELEEELLLMTNENEINEMDNMMEEMEEMDI